MNKIVIFLLFFISIALVEFIQRVMIGRDLKNTSGKRLIYFYTIMAVLYEISNSISGARFYQRYFSHDIDRVIHGFTWVLCFIVLFYVIVMSIRLLANNIKRKYDL